MTNSAFTQAERAAFDEHGYVVVRGLAPQPVVESMRRAALEDLEAVRGPVEYEADVGYPGAPSSVDAPGGRTVRRLLQASSRAAVFREWGTGETLAGRLRQLLGPSVVLAQAHHNCIMTKHPRYGTRTGWHRDIRYWRYEQEALVSVWTALVPEHATNGALLVIPGSHLIDLTDEQLDDAQFFREDHPASRDLVARAVTVELAPGDVLFFHCRLLHAAGANLTGETKYSVVFTYRAAANRPIAGSRSASLPDIPLKSL